VSNSKWLVASSWCCCARAHRPRRPYRSAAPDVIEVEVDEFCDFLADVDPADFVRQGGPPELPAAKAATDDIDGDSTD
jgi:hypothetical protein